MITLVVRKTIQATPERLFEAWTEPAQLRQWWGPQGVECVDAQIDLRVGGQYRIANRFSDGRVVWISGQFEVIEPPQRLTFTWNVEPRLVQERVTVRFDRVDTGTEVVIVHERIADTPTRDQHEEGWRGCLEGLLAFVTADTASPDLR